MIVLVISLTALMAAIAALHLAWAIGFWWPIRDEAALARAVVGTKDITRMPGAVPCALVAVAVGFVASLPWTPGFPFQKLLLTGAALVFLGRGLVAYLPFWGNLSPEEPFRRLDRQVYAPLCLAIGACYLLIILTGASMT